jgi:hypothetical protein
VGVLGHRRLAKEPAPSSQPPCLGSVRDSPKQRTSLSRYIISHFGDVVKFVFSFLGACSCVLPQGLFGCSFWPRKRFGWA